jgi:peptide/nickel transport system ATP-binding protein
MTPPEPVLEVRGLSVEIAVEGGVLHAVRGVDLQVGRSETLCIVGESGCGKSMTSLALMGLLPSRARRSVSHLRLSGEDLAAATPARMEALRGDRMAMVFQEPMTALNPAYSIGNQLVEGLLRHRPGTTHAAATTRAVGLLEVCGVGQAADRLRQYPHQLSGGLRQRVMIAMALMTEPSLLIADEPTTALDATIQAQILGLLARLKRDFSLAVVLVTHNIDVVRHVGDRVAVMYAGEVVETGAKADVLAHPAHPYTRALLSCVPTDAPRRAGERLGFLAGTVPSLVGALRGCQFRNRCVLASAPCAGEVPIQQVGGRGHTYRCVIAPHALPTRTALANAGATGAIGAAPAPSTAALALRGVEVTYTLGGTWFARRARLRALRGVSLDVQHGQALGIVGESGSGKSTLARVMLGLEAPAAGSVLLKGVPVADHGRAARARILQPIFQDPYSSLNPRRSVADAVRLPLDIHGLGSVTDRDATARRMMDLCGLPRRLAHALPSQLSGGQRQRVAIASALVMRPEIVVCDEPTSALDVSVQAQILNLLQDLRAELPLTYVVISHDLNVIRCLADRVAVMYLGAVVEEGPIDDVFAAPAHPYSRVLLAATLHGSGRTELVGEFPNPLQPPTGCAFHPRCARAQSVCLVQTPILGAAGARRVACHFPGNEPQGNPAHV